MSHAAGRFRASAFVCPPIEVTVVCTIWSFVWETTDELSRSALSEAGSNAPVTVGRAYANETKVSEGK